jgi:hypothetical protein
MEGRASNSFNPRTCRASPRGIEMGRGRKAPEKPYRRNVAGTEGVADQQEKNQVEQKGIIEAAVSTIRHFFGAFSPSVL